jgi:hypothetical protein
MEQQCACVIPAELIGKTLARAGIQKQATDWIPDIFAADDSKMRKNSGMTH